MAATSPNTRPSGAVAVSFRFLHLTPDAPLALIDAAVKVLTVKARGQPWRIIRIHTAGDHARAWASRQEEEAA